MTDENDKNTEVSVSLEDKSLKLKSNSRAINALDRLAGNLIDFPNPFIEKLIKTKRAKTEGEIKVIEGISNSIAEVAVNESDFIKALSSSIYNEHYGKLLNRHAIAQKAIPLIESEQTPDSSPNMDDIDPDWMNKFIDYAGSISSDKLQDMWAKLLSLIHI